MDHTYCPGSRLLRQPKPEIVSCPTCHGEVEIWSDEIKGTCPGCKRTVFKDGSMACLEWCKYGEDCVGTEIYATYRRNRVIGLKQRLLAAVEAHFGEDLRRIDHTRAVLEEAERLLAAEGGDPHIVVPASILHDVGVPAALAKHGSAAGRYQELEGPPIARKMLLAAGMKMEEVEEVCAIVGHHHSPGAFDTPSFRVVYDADCLVNLAEGAPGLSAEELRSTIGRTFLTASGRERAEAAYLSGKVLA